ncbi:MAG: glycosyltransferase [Lactococcus lactis]
MDSYENVVLRFVKINNVEKELGVRLYLDRGSISQYYRLFIADIFKGYNGRVLYLDCDTVIVDDIQELMTLDLSNNVIAALKDAFSRHYRKNIELKDNDIMFNSGVMLIDLKKWREENIENRIIVFF